MSLPITLYETDGFSPAEAPVFKLWQNTPGLVTVWLKEDDGSTYVIAPTATIELLVMETWACKAADRYFTAACNVESASEGKVSVSFSASTLTAPGIYLGELTVSLAGVPAKRFRAYVEITPSLNSEQTTTPLTIAEIRAAVRDRCAEDNYLLDKVEFQDGDIMFAIRRPIDWWNETAPSGVKTYSYTTFPYRYHWTDAVIGELLKQASFQLARNRIQLNAGGITTDDKARADLYLKLGQDMMDKFKRWAVSRMGRENIENWSGYVRSGYF